MYITREYVREHPEKIFIFGDNCSGTGYGGQAKELRGEPNSYGVPTKNYPSMKEIAFFSDSRFDSNMEIIYKAINSIPIDGREIVVLPLGVGLAQLPQRAPETYKHMLVMLLRSISGCGLRDVKNALGKYDFDFEKARCFLRYFGIAINFKLKKMNPDTDKFYTYAEYQVAKKFGDLVDE